MVDVNVWVALATPGHVHHVVAREWLEEAVEDRLLFCRVTQMGFLRLVTNPRVMDISTVTAARAWDAFDEFLRDSRVSYAAEPVDMEAHWRPYTSLPKTGPNFWTDAYLAAFAAAGGFTVVTFDHGFARFPDAPVRLLA